MVITILIACGAWILVRTEGMTSDIGHDFTWRWKKTAEDRLLDLGNGESIISTEVPTGAGIGAYWPGFRGPDREGIIHGVQIEMDWSVSPPVELWRQPIGPGWSSFAVGGDLLYTQEQRGEDELVTCYNVSTGKLVWRHGDKARFVGADANPGPRATPTLHEDRIYSFGATGILNALDADSGDLLWSRNAASDAGVEVPVWGFSSSPLVFGDIVIIHAVDKLIAYDLTSGETDWKGSAGTGYSSPHLVTIDGVQQIIMLSGVGATSFSPDDGTKLWEYSWPVEDRILQPALTPDGDILLSNVLKSLRRVKIIHGSDGWKFEEQWTCNRLKSNFNDLVVHKGHVYGFDGPVLACIELSNGTRTWRGKRYGGQIVLLADQDLILVVSEKGELALVKAVPDRFTELARFQAIEGKTWNHPVLVNDILVVRNSQEMAAFRISLVSN
jgi:hypothetical protein